MRRLGVHTSIAGGIEKSLERAAQLGCNTLQIFSHSPRVWHVKERSQEEYASFRRLRQQTGIEPVFVHTSYLINLASRDRPLSKKSVAMVTEEMNIADLIGADYLVLHTGSAAGDDPREARKRAVAALSQVSKNGEWRTGILLENTAGERGDITSAIAELCAVMEQVDEKLVAGVCIDTCHAYAAGYDVASVAGLATFSEELERNLGCEKVRLIHLNDSRGGIGSRLDRHEHIGKGKIGIKGFTNFLRHRCFAGVPIILETPKKTENDDPTNLRTVKSIIRKISRTHPLQYG
jgi:deoxyribonuclease-4